MPCLQPCPSPALFQSSLVSAQPEFSPASSHTPARYRYSQSGIHTKSTKYCYNIHLIMFNHLPTYQPTMYSENDNFDWDAGWQALDAIEDHPLIHHLVLPTQRSVNAFPTFWQQFQLRSA